MDNLDDPKTWDLIQSGKVVGCFQIRTPLGRAWCKKIAPDSIEHLSAVISLVRPGCLSKDSQIFIKYYTDYRKQNVFRWKKLSIETLYERFQKNKSKIEILSYDEINHTLVNNNITNVIYSGKKDLYKIKYRRQYWKCRPRQKARFLECTLDHPIYVHKRGWTKLEDIQIGDRILIVSERQDSSPKAFKQACIDNYIYQCVFCNWKDGALDVNHLEGNRKTNNHPDNLCFLCPNHHRMYSEKTISKEEIIPLREQFRLPQHERMSWVIYEGCEYIGKDDTYDITMESPHHNFIADNVVVHNCLEVIIDGKSVPQKYADRKNGLEEIEYQYPCLEPILSNTLGLMIYQEQAIRIGRDIAGLSLEEADLLRRAIGKKNTEDMAKSRNIFIEGCKKTGIVTEEVAIDIFDMIEKSQRYSFNVAHGISYALLGYEMAYYKTHHPIEFFCGNLSFSDEKSKPLEEYAILVSDAKGFDVDVCIPDIRDLKESFYIKDNKIYYGLGNVKSVGAQGKKICKLLAGKDLNFTWYQFLRDYSDKINKTAITNLVSVGAFDYLGVARNRLIYEYDIWSKISSSKVSTEWLKDKEFPSLRDALEACAKSKKDGGGCANVNKVAEMLDLVKVLDHPPYSLEDTPGWIAQKEKELLGISITFHSVDDCNTEVANCTCKDFLAGYTNNSINIAVELNRVSEYTTTKGKNPGQLMAFITGSDSTGSLDVITCFSAEYATFKELLVEGNTVIISGSRSKQNSLVVKAVHQI